MMQETKGRAELPFPTSGIIGAIAGDCFGAAYEFHPVKYGNFDIYKEPRFTDDTVMTWLLQPKGWKCRKNWLVVYIIMCLMIIFVRYLMSLTGAIKQESCRHHSRQDSLFKKRTYSPNSFSIFFMMSVLLVENSDLS